MHTLLSFLFSFVLWTSPAKPVTEADIIQTVGLSLRSGDAGKLSAKFARNIELVIDTEQVEFPSVQATHAELILRSFFRKYPPHSFQFIYKGTSDSLRYSTGTYETNGKNFSVYVLMRRTDKQQYVINTLHFRQE